MVNTVLRGVGVRLGTALTAVLLGYGLSEEHINVLVPAVVVIIGVAVDLLVDKFAPGANQ